METLNIAELRRLMRPSSAHSTTGGVLFMFAWGGFADSVMRLRDDYKRPEPLAGPLIASGFPSSVDGLIVISMQRNCGHNGEREK